MSSIIPHGNGKTFLITGINGYIASNIGYLVLSKGYSLHGTVRRQSSVKPLLEGAYAPFLSRVKIFEVPDITVPGAFDASVAGVDAIIHIASPADFKTLKFEYFINPAREGTNTLLKSAFDKAGSQLQSVVFTSSVRTILGENSVAGKVYNEANRPTDSLALAEAQNEAGITSSGTTLYGASKMAAEQATWAFRDKFRPKFSISTIHPSIVIGPPVQPPKNAENLNETLRPIWKIFSATPPSTIPPQVASGSFVDVRDVAALHLWVAENSSVADGERYIASNGPLPYQAVADILRCQYPERKGIPVGVPGMGYVGYEDFETGNQGDCVWGVQHCESDRKLDSSKAKLAMEGRRWYTLNESVVDTAKVFEVYL